MIEYFAVFIGNKKTGRIENRCTDVSPQVVGVGGLRASGIHFELIAITASEYLVSVKPCFNDQFRLTLVMVERPFDVNAVGVTCGLPLLPALKTENDSQKYKAQHKQGSICPVSGG